MGRGEADEAGVWIGRSAGGGGPVSGSLESQSMSEVRLWSVGGGALGRVAGPAGGIGAVAASGELSRAHSAGRPEQATPPKVQQREQRPCSQPSWGGP